MNRTLIVSKSKRTTWMTLCLTIAVALWLPAAASADVVSGRVLGPDEKPILNNAFSARDAKGQATPFKTDKSGNFSVYLDPGKYVVSFSADATLEGVIESYPQPVQQDIRLKKKGQ